MRRVLALCAAALLAACGAREATTLQGYAEAD